MFLMSYGYNPTSQQQLEPVTEDHSAVESLTPSLAVFNNTTAEMSSLWRANRAARQNNPVGKRVRDYLKTIKKRAESTNQQFASQHLPYQITVDLVGNDEILIDLAVLDKKGVPIRHSKRNITNENFSRLMEDISTGKGLLLDSMPNSYH
jgi:hypothetical protein